MKESERKSNEKKQIVGDIWQGPFPILQTATSRWWLNPGHAVADRSN